MLGLPLRDSEGLSHEEIAEVLGLEHRTVTSRLHRVRMELKALLEVQGVLTPEQLAKASELNGRLRELRAEMRSLLTGEP